MQFVDWPLATVLSINDQSSLTNDRTGLDKMEKINSRNDSYLCGGRFLDFGSCLVANLSDGQLIIASSAILRHRRRVSAISRARRDEIISIWWFIFEFAWSVCKEDEQIWLDEFCRMFCLASIRSDRWNLWSSSQFFLNQLMLCGNSLSI